MIVYFYNYKFNLIMSDKILLNYKGNLDVSVSFNIPITQTYCNVLGYSRSIDWLESKPNLEDLRQRLYESV